MTNTKQLLGIALVMATLPVPVYPQQNGSAPPDRKKVIPKGAPADPQSSTGGPDRYAVSLGKSEQSYLADGGGALWLAAMKGDVAELKKLITPALHVDAVDNFGWTPLAYAARHGRVDAVRFLLSVGADVNRKNGWNNTTALILASYFGRTQIVKLLLNSHADVIASTTQGATAMSEAASEAHSDIVELLRQARAER